MEVSMFVVLCMLQVCDVYTTKRILDTKIGHEANPFMAWFINKLGVFAGLVTPKIGLLVLTYYYLKALPIALFALCVMYIAVIINNIKVLRK